MWIATAMVCFMAQGQPVLCQGLTSKEQFETEEACNELNAEFESGLADRLAAQKMKLVSVETACKLAE